ncbi:hypothetical protein HK105_202951 [Polyrhizophydium stewartii]|uniref:Uncharacterized protein n=1 Tax=Polyrhizophydium stewartii TaxID=2732419 RepID=A0ABR4NDP8_9FUNG
MGVGVGGVGVGGGLDASGDPDDAAGLPAEEKRVNYLDIVRENMEQQNKTAMTYRVIVAGELAKDLDRVELSAYYQRFFKRQQSESELITGILLIFRGSFVHVVEATQKVVYAFIRDIGSRPTFIPKSDAAATPTTAPNAAGAVAASAAGAATGQGAAGMVSAANGAQDAPAAQPAVPMMNHVRVLLVSDDTPVRFYPFWASRVIDSKDDASREVDMSLFADPESLDKLSELKHAFEEITDRYRDLLPHQNLLSEIAACADIISVDEWLEAFEGHIKLVLESELVWPAPKPLVV